MHGLTSAVHGSDTWGEKRSDSWLDNCSLPRVVAVGQLTAVDRLHPCRCLAEWVEGVAALASMSPNKIQTKACMKNKTVLSPLIAAASVCWFGWYWNIYGRSCKARPVPSCGKEALSREPRNVLRQVHTSRRCCSSWSGTLQWRGACFNSIGGILLCERSGLVHKSKFR